MHTPLIVDAHLDLAYNALALHREVARPLAEIRAADPADSRTALVSLPGLMAGRVAVVGASLFTEAASRQAQQTSAPVYHTPDEAHQQGVAQLDFYRRWIENDPRVRILQTAADLEAVLRSWEGDAPQVGLFLAFEGADPIREPGELEWWRERGVRGVGLTWALGSRYAGGNHTQGPLTEAGRALLRRMEEARMWLDLSHMAPEAAVEALERYTGPVIASHANPRAFVDRPRMLTDEMLRRLAERGGVVGLMPVAPMFMADWRRNDARPPLSRFIEVIDYVCQTTGTAAVVGLGSDFDGGFGIESTPLGLDSSADLPLIASLLTERGYSDADIAAIMGGNWLRVMRQCLPA